MGGDVIISGADMSSSVHIDNKNKDILILGEGPVQGLDDSTLIAEAIYPIDFTQPNKRFVLSLQYNGCNSLLLSMLQKYNNSKQKTVKQKIIHCVKVIFLKILQSIIWKNRIERKCNFFFFFFFFFFCYFNPIHANHILDIHRCFIKGK